MTFHHIIPTGYFMPIYRDARGRFISRTQREAQRQEYERSPEYLRVYDLGETHGGYWQTYRLYTNSPQSVSRFIAQHPNDTRVYISARGEVLPDSGTDKTPGPGSLTLLPTNFVGEIERNRDNQQEQISDNMRSWFSQIEYVDVNVQIIERFRR